MADFLPQAFRPGKAAFLLEHGDWWYNQSRARYIAVAPDGRVAGYTALIHSQVLLAGQKCDMMWWVDLIVLPQYRGQGLQTQLDREVRELEVLRLGFPNTLAAGMHLRHGWGVREDAQRRTLYLSWRGDPRLRGTRSLKGRLARAAAQLLEALASLRRRRMLAYRPRQARPLIDPNADLLAGIFQRYHPAAGHLTSYRDTAFIRWRYLDAPYYNQLRFYTAGPPDVPALAAVTRLVEVGGIRTLRLLDIWGHFDDRPALDDLLRLILREAVAQGAERIVAIASLPALNAALARVGVGRAEPVLFCWYSSDADQMQAVAAAQSHWTIADSDNDDPP